MLLAGPGPMRYAYCCDTPIKNWGLLIPGLRFVCPGDVRCGGEDLLQGILRLEQLVAGARHALPCGGQSTHMRVSTLTQINIMRMHTHMYIHTR